MQCKWLLNSTTTFEKVLSKTWTKKEFPNHDMNVTYKKLTVKNTLNGEKLNSSSLRYGIKQGCLL